nr:unnamed protein product [Digitaria exilis]
MPSGMIKKLTSLEELVIQCSEKCGKYHEGQFKELGSLTELRVLTIKIIDMNWIMLSDLLDSVGNLHKLKSLKLEDQNVCSSLSDQAFNTVPLALPQHLRHLLVGVYWFSSLCWCINLSSLINLSHLELRVDSMDEHTMQILARLPELRHLALSTKSAVTVTNIATDGCFQKLRVCRFYSSVVLFVLNEDSSVSFTLWKRRFGGSIVFGSMKKDECRRAPAVMPNLQELLFNVDRFYMMKCAGNYGNLGLEYLTSLKEVTVSIDCDFCPSEAKVIEAEAGLRHAISIHPNHPTLILRRFNEHRLRKSSVHL